MNFLFNRISGNFLRFYTQTLFIVKTYIIGLLLFFFARLCFILTYGNKRELLDYKFDLIHSFITGMRYDTVVLTYAFVFLLFVCVVNVFLRNGKYIEQLIIDKLMIYFSILALSFITIICVIDFYFYKFFSSHISVIAFGIIDDDSKALIKSMWVDYPVIRILLVVIVIIVLLKLLVSYVYAKQPKSIRLTGIYRVLYIIVYLGIFIFGMRCSFGDVPLEIEEASISANSFINNIPINGVFALKNAMSERKVGVIDISEKKYLEQYNYKSNKEIVDDYLKYILRKSVTSSSTTNIDSISLAQTPQDKYLEENPPNIVFLQMESMSSYFFSLQAKQFNMLGALQPELHKCIVFKNFISCRNFTIFSMDGLLVNSPLSPISQSKYLNVSFKNSSLIPFVNNGYETYFITGGRLNWRNLDQYLPRQGFDKLEGGADIQKNCPEAVEEHEWGVYDEFLMERIVQKLKQKRSKPIFIYGVSISYHSPYRPPSTYNALPVVFGDKQKALVNSTTEQTRQTFVCFQYMCNTLGNFIHEITNSSLASNTIIIATGDHSSHIADNLFGFTGKDLMDWYGVPLIVYIPEQLKKKLYIDASRFGSHKDIFPTLYNLSLSNTTYYNSGNNLFSTDTSANYYGLYEYYTAINKYGCTRFTKGAYSYFNWLDKVGGTLIDAETASPKLVELGKEANAYSAFNWYNTIRQLTDKRNIIYNIRH